MREILFRGKRVDNGEWVYGFLCKTYSPMNPKTRDAIMHSNLENGYPEYSCAEINVATVGQYTGLTDKNGKRIFEGDIISVARAESSGIFSVRFIERYAAFGLYDDQSEQYIDMFHSLSGLYTIIGNIHDNPELLKGEGK